MPKTTYKTNRKESEMLQIQWASYSFWNGDFKLNTSMTFIRFTTALLKAAKCSHKKNTKSKLCETTCTTSCNGHCFIFLCSEIPFSKVFPSFSRFLFRELPNLCVFPLKMKAMCNFTKKLNPYLVIPTY